VATALARDQLRLTTRAMQPMFNLALFIAAVTQMISHVHLISHFSFDLINSSEEISIAFAWRTCDTYK
jgi:hypothetical protein